MEEITETEVCDLEAKRDGRGRRIAGEDERARLIADYEVSGLTQREFARREGVNYHTFVAWLGRHRRGGCTGGPGGGRAAPVRFEEIALGAAAGPAPLEVQLPGGVVVRGADPRAVAELLGLLEGRR